MPPLPHKLRVARFLLCASFLAIALFSRAQDNQSARFARLEHLIKAGVDSVRLAHGLPCLYNDSTLYMAARFHGKYLRENRKLTHFQEDNRKTRTPQLRAEYFGATNYLVGENVAFSFRGKRVKMKSGAIIETNSDEALARSIVIGWVNSPGHYANIITPRYQITGVAVAEDPTSQKVYAVQKFAQVPYQYEFVENRDFFKLSPVSYEQPEPGTAVSSEATTAHNLTRFSPGACEECVEAADEMQQLSQLEYKGTKVYLRVESGDAVRKVMRAANDGFMLETVSYEPYVCSNPAYATVPAYRNGNGVINDYGHEPIYQKELASGYKRQKEIKLKSKLDSIKISRNLNLWQRITFRLSKQYEGGYFKLYLGDMANHPAGGSLLEANVVIIKDGQACHVLRFTNYSGAPHNHPDTLSHIVPELSPVTIKPDTSFYYHSVRFQANQVEIRPEQLANIMRQIRKDNMLIDSIHINAQSSVEGNALSNKRLQEKRAQNMLNQFQGVQEPRIKARVRTTDSWPLFYGQLANHDKLQHYVTRSRAELEERLRDSVFADSVAHFLRLQRVAKVYIYTSEDTTGTGIERFLTDRLDKYLALVETQTIGSWTYNKSIDSALHVQRALAPIAAYNLTARVFQAPADRRVNFVPLLVQAMYLNKDSVTGPTPIKTLHRLTVGKDGFFPNTSYITRYNLLLGYLKLAPADRKRVAPLVNMVDLAEMETKRAPANLKKQFRAMLLSYWFALATPDPGTRSARNEVDQKRGLMGVFNELQHANLSDTMALKVARFMTWGGEPALGYHLLTPQTLSADCLPEILTYHALLGYWYNGFSTHPRYAQMMIDLRPKLSRELWCDLFVGPEKLSFQLFDHAGLRERYCAECAEHEAAIIEGLRNASGED